MTQKIHFLGTNFLTDFLMTLSFYLFENNFKRFPCRVENDNVPQNTSDNDNFKFFSFYLKNILEKNRNMIF